MIKAQFKSSKATGQREEKGALRRLDLHFAWEQLATGCQTRAATMPLANASLKRRSEGCLKGRPEKSPVRCPVFLQQFCGEAVDKI
jgi:hypothetical protein